MTEAPERICTSQCGKTLVHDGMKRFETDVEYIRTDHVDALLKAEREKALREAAEVCTYVIKNYDVMEPGKPDQFASLKTQKAAKGMVSLARQDIEALISDDKTDG